MAQPGYGLTSLSNREAAISSAKQILVVGPAWVGDMVMAQSLFKTLKDKCPDCEIDVLAPQWSLPILQRMAEVRRGISLPVKHKQLGLMTRWKLGRQLCSAAYDQAIVLPRSFKAALVPWFAGIPIRTGYRGESRYAAINDMRSLDKSILTRTVQRYTALGLTKDESLPPLIHFPNLKVEQQRQQQLLQQLELKTDKPVIAMMPGAEYGPAKQWPVEHFRQLASQLIEQGYRVWIFGSAKERELADEIAVNAEIINLCGRTQLEDVIDLMACCQTAVSNDSGLMHIAAATGVRVIVIYGSSTPDYTPPLTDKAEIVYHRLECSPCFERTCRYKHYNCLQGIGVKEILEII